MTTPRGVRNNNPGNIDYNPRNAWQGQLGLEVGVPSPRFARFDTPENGIRALGKLLINYRGKDGMPGVGGPGIDTVRETITRWAPGNENNTDAYITAVARRLGVNANDVIDVRKLATLRVMVTSIISHECAGFAYPEAVLAEGLRRALA
ncbi:structural protein P5 [Pseudomonas palleroniana]|uniref:structural protein P5 n=1 Tax=Pseudomonas palleroniana TaxID=191390 RepID=UPI0018E69FDA|nr:structural protein P5 [Pseudomonas palleroniana]